MGTSIRQDSNESVKKCRYCSSPILAAAKVCPICKLNQRWWLNYFRIGDLLLLISICISFGMVYFSYSNFHEAREERIKASDAANRALQAENLVKAANERVAVIEESSRETENQIKKVRDNIVKEYKTISVQVSLLKEINMLSSLAAKAISDQEAQAYRELEKYAKDPNKKHLKAMAEGEIAKVKTAYVLSHPSENRTLTYTAPDGTKKIDSQIPTHVLISFLKDPDWYIRDKAVTLLGRNEKGVPEALLASFDDPNLFVAKHALESFIAITSFKSQPDIFDFVKAKEWYKKNASELKKKLKDCSE